MIGTTITLNDAEQRLARYVARARQEHDNQSEHITERKIGPQSQFETNLNGMGAEIAFCRLMNVYPSLDVVDNPAADPQGDCVVLGRTVDVKATRYKNGQLLAVLWKEKKDVYGLMTGTFPTYEFRGLADGDDLLSADNIVDLGHGPTYALAQEALR